MGIDFSGGTVVVLEFVQRRSTRTPSARAPGPLGDEAVVQTTGRQSDSTKTAS